MSDGEPISVIEELDPEPVHRNKFRQKSDLLLGMLVLIAVLGWAGWQWWQARQVEAVRQEYRWGVEAAEKHSWDEARLHFAAAAGYSDADSRADAAAQTIVKRDRHYTAAAEATDRGRWLTAFSELRALRDIQPGYKDDEALSGRVEGQVYAGALEGAVALRLEAEPPGLYYRFASGWQWLQGSDKWSRVRGGGRANAVVYDVPGPGWRPGPTPTPVPSNRTLPTGSPELAGRRLKVAIFEGDKLGFKDLLFDPAQYNSYLVGTEGVVALRSAGSISLVYNSPIRQSYINFDTDYQAYPSPIITLSRAAHNEQVMDFQKDGLALTATWSGISVRESNLRLYLVNAAGGSRRLIYTFTGQFGGAQISLDGRYALVVTIVPGEEPTEEKQAVVLLDLESGSAHVLAEEVGKLKAEGGYFAPSYVINAAFLRKGAWAGKVLVARQVSDKVEVSLYDPSAPGNPTMQADLPGPATIGWVYEGESDGSLLLLGRAGSNDLSSVQPGAVSLLIAKLDPNKPPTSAYLVYKWLGGIADARVWGDYFVHIYNGIDLEARKPGVNIVHAVYRLPLGQLGTTEVQPEEVYTSAPQVYGANSYAEQNIYLGHDLLAYTQNGSLHVRAYNSDADAVLESGVTLLINPQQYAGVINLP